MNLLVNKDVIKITHTNNGKCEKCLQIFNRYPNPEPRLLQWFLDLQLQHPEAHISCCGRGEQEQNELYLRKATKAQWGKSAHNYNAAIDIFVQTPGNDNLYPFKWYTDILKPKLQPFLLWYGMPHSAFFELPHCEILAYRELAIQKQLSLVE